MMKPVPSAFWRYSCGICRPKNFLSALPQNANWYNVVNLTEGPEKVSGNILLLRYIFQIPAGQDFTKNPKKKTI